MKANQTSNDSLVLLPSLSLGVSLLSCSIEFIVFDAFFVEVNHLEIVERTKSSFNIKITVPKC